MKKVVRIMALILAFACLFSGTVFADEYNFKAGEVVVGIVAGVNIEDYETLFPEIDIALVKYIRRFTDGTVFVDILLADNSDNAEKMLH